MRTPLLVASLVIATAVDVRAQIPLPAFGSSFVSTSATRGYWLTAPPVPFLITGLRVPNEGNQPFQAVEVIDLGTTPPPAYASTVLGTQLFYSNNTAAGTIIPTSILIPAGRVIGVLGLCTSVQGGGTGYNSYGTPVGPFTSSILGNPVTLTRFGTQFNIAVAGNNPVWQEAAAAISRVEMFVSPTNGLFADFSATPTTGGSPLTVNFTDHTYTSDPGGVTSWAWDLDGDGIIDSTVQNPTFVYNNCGSFNVSLTVTDASHPPSTTTRNNYISTDDITANFTFSLLAPPNVFQFTDTSTPPATAWAWDFNNDGIIDSTAQNPVALLPLCQGATIRLTATRNCKSNSRTQTTIISPFSLPTIFASNNSGAALWTNYFDANVANPQGINICGLAVNTTSAAGVAFSVDVYVTPGTYVGADGTPAVWRLAGTATGTTSATNTPSIAALPSPVYLSPGSYGVAIRYNGVAPAYTNGTGANQSYSNGDLTLTLGASRATTAGPFNGGATITPRVWNGTLFYDALSGAATAGYGFFGAGCAGSLGIANLVNTSRPQVGTTLTVNLNHLPLSVAIMMVGFSKTTSGFGPLPLDLTPLGAPGCSGRVSPDVTLFLAGAANAATWNLTVPNVPAFIGQLLYNQALVLDPGFNTLGAVVSDAAGLMIGN
jgi:PKD repeat protein